MQAGIHQECSQECSLVLAVCRVWGQGTLLIQKQQSQGAVPAHEEFPGLLHELWRVPEAAVSPAGFNSCCCSALNTLDAKLIYSCSAVQREGCGILHVQSFICWMKTGPSLESAHPSHSLQPGFHGICSYLTAADGIHPSAINCNNRPPLCGAEDVAALSHSSVYTFSRFSLI